MRTLVQNVYHRTHRSKNEADARVTTVFGFAVLGGVIEKWTARPVAASRAIFRCAEARGLASPSEECGGMLLFMAKCRFTRRTQVLL